jgi:glycosyltransferase involved in cell wall biosynthesis
MRILMIAPQPFFRPRGTPFSVLHRIRALVRLGHRVDLVTYPFGESPGLAGLRIIRSRRMFGVRDVPIGPSLAKLVLDGPLFARARQLARDPGYDLLHTHEEAGILGAWLASKLGITHLYDMHSSLPQQLENFGRFNWSPVVAAFRRLERYTLDGADGVIAICADLRDQVQASGYRGPVALIENTLDFDAPALTESDVRAVRQRLDIGDGPAIVYTGTLEAYQGLDLLVAAAPEVVRTVPGARFVLVGGTAEQIAGLDRRARELGAGYSFVFVPAVPPADVFVYQRLADVLVTTRSRGTNTPLKLYQYLRAGRPIVATRIRSHTQVLDDDTAELVSPSPEGVAKGLVRVLTDRAHAARLADGAARLARDRYSEPAYLEALGGLLEQATRAGAARRAAA